MRKWVLASLTVACCLAQQPAAESTEAEFRTGVNEIVVDFTVRDKRGRPVRDLKAGDVQILEEDQPQQVTSFREVVQGAGVTPELPAGPPKSQLKVERGIRLVTLVFERLGADGRRLGRQAALDFLKNDLGPNAFYGVFINDRNLRVLQSYTQDRDLLEAAVKKATSLEKTDYLNEGIANQRTLERTAGSVGTAAALDGGGANGQAPGQVNGGAMAEEQANRMAQQMEEFSQAVNRDVQGRSTVFGLWGVIDQLKPWPGRKSVLWFSEGLVMPNGVWHQFRAMIGAANQANVSIYSIDVRGLTPGSDQVEANARLAAAANRSYQTRNTETQDGRAEFRNMDATLDSIRANQQNNMRELAESTGGFLISNTNDMRAPLRRVSEDFNTYYEAIYRPKNPQYDGKFRMIQVKLNRPDVTVSAREGYFSLPPMEGQTVYPYEVPLLKALAGALPKDIVFRSAVLLYGHKPNGDQDAELIFDLPLSSIRFTRDEKAKVFRTRVSVLALIKDEQGRVVTKLSRDVPLLQPIDKVEALQLGRFIVTQPARLSPGRYVVESVVADQESGKASAKRAALVVTAPPPGPELSHLALVRRVEPKPESPDANDSYHLPQGKIVPTLQDEIPGGRGSLLSAYFVLYPHAGLPPSKLLLDMIQDGKLLKRIQPQLPDADATGKIPFMANIPVETLKPGLYELRATLLQGDKGTQRSLFVTIS